MFWGKNIKGGETIELDVNNMEGKILNLKSVALNEGEVNGKMTIIIVKKKRKFQLS